MRRITNQVEGLYSERIFQNHSCKRLLPYFPYFRKQKKRNQEYFILYKEYDNEFFDISSIKISRYQARNLFIFLVLLNQPEPQKFRVLYNRLATDENELFQVLIEHLTIKNVQSFIFFSYELYIGLYMNFYPTFRRQSLHKQSRENGNGYAR